jgi:hypothetical protein
MLLGRFSMGVLALAFLLETIFMKDYERKKNIKR